MNPTVAHLTARSLLGGRRVLLLAALPLVALVLFTLVRVLAQAEPATSAGLLSGFALATIVPLIGVIVGTGAIGPEIDDGAIVYLLAKPLRRSTIATTKYAVAALVVLAAAAVPTLAGGLILAGTEHRIAVAFAAGAAVAGLAYCALFLLLAVLTRNAVIVGLLYALVWESLTGTFVPGAQALSVRQWALAVTEAVLGDSAAALGVSSAVSLNTAIISLGLVTVGAVWFAGVRLRSLRLTSAE